MALPITLLRVLSVTFLVALLQVVSSQGFELPDKVVNSIIEQTQEIFLVNAAASPGDELALPADSALGDPLLPSEDAERVVFYAVPAGLAMWCGVAWQPHYQAFMRREQNLGLWSETQLAFIRSLFGMSQAFVANVMVSKPCTAEQRANVAEQLR